MDTDSFIVHVKTNNIYKDIAKNVETRFDTSNFEIDGPLPEAENKKVIRPMKDELGGQIMKEFVGLRAKTYNYLKDKDDEHIKAKVIKKCAIKKNLNFKIIYSVWKQFRLKIKETIQKKIKFKQIV